MPFNFDEAWDTHVIFHNDLYDSLGQQYVKIWLIADACGCRMSQVCWVSKELVEDRAALKMFFSELSTPETPCFHGNVVLSKDATIVKLFQA